MYALSHIASKLVNARRAANKLFPGLILALALTAGCNSFDPSKWDAKQMAAEATSQWKLTEVDLKPVTGGFEGTGKDANGESFEIKITTDPATKSATATGKGNRGTDLSFSVKPK
ncbi:MAG: hypothetical protein IT423_23675 [Pirellulaceae bacterium]|nr:hypothetical protein [Pirellulaceae bacterium]